MLPNKSALNNILGCKEFDLVMEVTTAHEHDFEGHYTVCYLKDVPLMFSLVLAVHEGVLGCHLQAVSQMLNSTFSFYNQKQCKILQLSTSLSNQSNHKKPINRSRVNELWIWWI